MADQKKLTRAEQIERFVKANAVTKDKGFLGHAQDAGLSLLSGAVSVPETAVGLADIVSGGGVGKALENQDGMFGFRPKEAKEAISNWKTERGKKQLQDFQEAEGVGAKFGQALSNPSLVTNTVLESLPAMGAGGVVGRGIGAVAPRLAGVAGGALGEGAVGAGLSAEQIRQQTEDGLLTPKQAGLAAATGVTTAGFGYAGGRIAKKLGLGDVDTALAGGGLGGSNKNIVRRTLEGALTEGFLEELPQSVSEQVLQNEALGKPLDEGVDEAAVLGLLSGGLMGGLAGAATRGKAAPNEDTPPSTDLVVQGGPQPNAGGPNAGGQQGQLDDFNRDYFNRGQGPDASGMRTLNPDPGLGFNRNANGFNAGPNGEVFTDDQYNQYLAQQQAQARAARDAGMTDINDVTQTPQGYERFGTDPRLPAPNDFTGSSDGTLQTAADIATGVNTAARQEQQAREDARARRARGEVLDITEVPAESGGFGFFGARPDNQTPAERMGIDATKGGLSAAAAVAVNSGVSPQADTLQQAASANNDMSRSAMRDVSPQPSSEQLTANSQIATGKDGSAKWFGREEKAQEFIAKKNISDTHEVVSAGKSRFEIQPKAQTTGPTAETSAVQGQTSAPKKSEARNTPVKDEAKSVGKAYTADNDEVPYQWDVVDAKDLVSSHTNTFGKNPDFPADAQPRDRANAGYQAQVLDIINKFNPELLGESALASAGSPIVGGKDNVVESGNGRTIAIRTKYENGSAEPYRQFVQSQAEKFGLDPETVAGMSEPVLVRRNLSDMDRTTFAERANKDDKASMGSTEIARIDAKAIPNTDLIEFDKNGSMNLNASRKFTQAFTKAVGTNEAGNLVDKDGNISQTGKLRITGALLHNAYNSDKLTRAVTETLDPSAQNVLKVLTDKAPQINKIKQHVESGKRTSSTLAEDIKTAAEKYIDLVESGANIDLFLANNDLFSEDAISEQAAEIIGDFYANPRSATKIGQDLQARIDADTRVNDPNEAGLFGVDEAPPVPNNKKRSILRSKNKPQEVSANEKSAAAENIQADPTRDTQKQATADATANANGKPAENKPPKTLGAGKEKRTFIGKNAAGEMIYEGENGIRSKRKGEFMASEPVKQRFITAFMKASNDKRSIDGDAVEENNDILESFSEAAGDPRILQRVKLQKKLEQLNSKERLYTRGIADMRREMRSQTNVAANEQASLDKINAKEVADILESQRENFNLVLGDKTYNKRADGTDALKTYIKDNVRLGDKSTLIGSYAGTPLYVAFKPMSTEAELVLTLSGYTFSGKGLAGLESVMRNLPKQIEKRIEGINKAKASVETLKKAITQPFMQKDELARVEKQIEALEADLELNPVPAPVWLRQGAPMDSEVFYDKRPFVVTGHQYSNDGYFVVAEDDKGTVLIPYLEAKDGVGMPLYDEQEFVPPEVIQQKDKDNPNNLTDADRVPDSSQETQSDNDQKFSRTGPVKGSTKTTPKQVIDKLVSKFGKSVIDKLIANGTLEIKTLNDYVVDGELVIPSDVDGIYHQGKAILIADNLSDDMIIPTFLHELGGHGGLQTLMDKKAYDALMRDFDALVKAGDPMAMQAKAMADSVARNKQDALDEYLPYLITLASRAKAKQGKIAGMINRIAMAIRSWLRNTLGMSVKMNAQDVLALAERMVEARTQQPLNNIQSPINSFEGVNAPQGEIAAVRKDQAKTLREAPNGKPSNLNEQQWLQVRTPAFKQWFGDWENDPANASKILDENGEPLVLYHGAKSDFWVFDMSRSVPQRNEGMMGMFFTDNAKTAAGYTVDLRKEAAVVKAKEDLAQINNEFGFKRRQLEVENKTGDEIQELTKKEFEAMKAAELKLKATVADAFNNAYDNAESRTKAVFVKSQMPFEQDADGKSFLAVNKKAAERYFVDGVYDGIVNNNVLDDANANHSVGAAKVVISFDATNIKSATDNVGAFSKTNDDIRYSQSNDGMKFSRAAGMNDQFDPINMARETKNRFHDWVSSAPPGKLSWWHKTIGTMYNLAQRSPYFKPVFDNTEKFINDVSYYAAKASEFAPKLLPKLDGLKDITKTAIGAKDNDKISKPIFEGTLLWGRDLNGKAVLIDDWRKKVMATSLQDRLQLLKSANRITPAQEAKLATLNNLQANRFVNGIIDDEVNAGLVWTDQELRDKFDLSDAQIELYREFRSATDNSLDTLTRSDMLRKLGKDANEIEKAVMQATSLRKALHEVEQLINKLSTAEPKKAQAYAKTLADIKTSVARTNKLIADGYAPLSRFGQYTVDVVDANGNREYFSLFESAYDARKMAKEMSDLYGADFVTQGTLSSEEFKMFAGVTPETAELFGEMLGLDATGDKAADEAFQEFLRRTKNNRSAMKRLIHRKGIKGYSEDVGRVLASFIYSNARHTSAALNMGNLDRSIQDIPKGEGQLKDAAVKLAQYIKNPQEEGSVIRGFMFAQYLGGSIASAVVNLTQPIAVSFPYLSQFGGAAKAAKQLTQASSDWINKRAFAADLQQAIEDAEADGTLSPQEVHNLLKQARGQNPLSAGDGTKYGNTKAAVQNTWSRVGLGWGAFFSLAEQINRRVTFVAAYRMAQDQGMADPAEFARKSIKETQFVYNKASRMQWGRGAIGGTLLTFKTYSVSYIELMHRLWTQGEKGSPERAAGRKAAWIMIGTLFLLGGGGGLPFMEDMEDFIDGAGQIMGYNFSSRKKREDALDAVFGEMLGDFLESGISGIPGAPTDVSGRLGMDNLIPGTGVFKQRTSNTKDVLELAGPAGDFVSRVGTGTRSILKGAVSGDARQVGRGALELAPVAVRNAVKGSDMLASGIYKDTKGYKVDDVTPIDAAFKAIGFQPKDISKVQGAAWLSQSGTAYYNLRASEIRSLWAAGISEGNKSKIADAQAALKDWNKKNPDQVIVIRPTDIQRRIREMNMNKSDRVTKLAPKTMRAQIQDDFANARGEY